MAAATKICKVCGKEYPYCKTELKGEMFRWQDVACCEEHGAEYFKRVLIARGELQEEKPVKKVQKKAKVKEEAQIEVVE